MSMETTTRMILEIFQISMMTMMGSLMYRRMFLSLFINSITSLLALGSLQEEDLEKQHLGSVLKQILTPTVM